MVLLLRCFVVVILLNSIIIQTSSATDFPKKNITVGLKKIVAEIAETPDQLQRGMMFRSGLGENEGMLFVFKNEETRFFWMKNTLIDLSIGFFDKNKKLVDIQEMKSGKNITDSALPSYGSTNPAMYALEMNKGWFDKNKIKLGSKLKIH
jgi:uncharacterized membrane protein (UPF0127 family)